MKENPIRSLPGIPVVLLQLVVIAVCVWLMLTTGGALPVLAVVVALLVAFSVVGLYMVEPNQAAVLSLFGRYVGTAKENGLRWNNPFLTKKKVS